ncbi:DUF6221 family protein [Streptomyces sp. NBC_00885]|uniref:DUF6221 family protein n=1 Tax=Streptomyces sp. NBC_00885 TaxID=2975857 RepID=UPI00386F6982|nr:DUF6221 family protein [Streptomyces sp. NBC_00885]
MTADSGVPTETRWASARFHPTIAQHVALHDPARVLRDVEAKRRVPARHTLSPPIGDPALPWDNRSDCQYDEASPFGAGGRSAPRVQAVRMSRRACHRTRVRSSRLPGTLSRQQRGEP